MRELSVETRGVLDSLPLILYQKLFLAVFPFFFFFFLFFTFYFFTPRSVPAVHRQGNRRKDDLDRRKRANEQGGTEGAEARKTRKGGIE